MFRHRDQGQDSRSHGLRPRRLPGRSAEVVEQHSPLSTEEFRQVCELLRLRDARFIREHRPITLVAQALEPSWNEFRRTLQEKGDACRKEQERSQSWLRSETFEGDVILLLIAHLEGASKEERWGITRRLARRFSARFRDPAAASHLRQERAARGKHAVLQDLREYVFPAAILLVFGTLNELRYVKLGRYWAMSRRIPTQPESVLTESEFPQWVRQEVRNAAEAILLDRPYPPPLDSNASSSASADNPTPDPAIESAVLLRAVGARISPRQRELLEHLKSGVPVSEVHARMGIQPGTTRVMLHQIRKRQPA